MDKRKNQKDMAKTSTLYIWLKALKNYKRNDRTVHFCYENRKVSMRPFSKIKYHGLPWCLHELWLHFVSLVNLVSLTTSCLTCGVDETLAIYQLS